MIWLGAIVWAAGFLVCFKAFEDSPSSVLNLVFAALWPIILPLAFAVVALDLLAGFAHSFVSPAGRP